MPEAEQTSWFNRRLDEATGSLNYAGKILDKTFGGRAIRGILGGRPEEALSIIPGSDTLGLTREDNTVQGTDVLRHLGFISNDDGWQNQAAGFGAELALDPSTFLGIGALTKGGQAAAKAGTLAGKTSERIAAGQAKLLDFGFPLQKTLFGIDRTPFNIGGADTSAAIARNFLGAPLSAAESVAKTAEAYPGEWTRRVLGFNPVTLAGNVGDAAYRQSRVLFDQPVLGANSRTMQDVAGETISPAFRALKGDVDIQAGKMAVDLHTIAGADSDKMKLAQQYMTRVVETPKDVDAKLATMQDFLEKQGLKGSDRMREVRSILEDNAATDADKLDRLKGSLVDSGMKDDVVDKQMGLMKLIGEQTRKEAAINGPEALKFSSVFSPDELKVLGDHAQASKDLFEQWNTLEQSFGAKSPSLVDVMDYAPRQMGHVPKQPGESLPTYFARTVKSMTARHEFQQGRLDAFHDIPGGTDALNTLGKDARFSGSAREMAPGVPTTDLAATDALLPILTGKTRQELEDVVGGDLAIKKASDLADRLKNLDPIYAKTQSDIFPLDFAARFKQRGHAYAKVDATQQGIYEGIARTAQPREAFGSGQATQLTDLLNQAGLDARVSPDVAPTAWSILADRMKLQNVDDVKNLWVPNDVARDLRKLGKAWSSPEDIKPVMQAWSMAMNMFKSAVTVPYPGFHVRNIATALFDMHRDDALSIRALKNADQVRRGGYLDAKIAEQLYPGMAPKEATNEWLKTVAGTDTGFTRIGRQSDEVLGGLGGNLQYNLPTTTGVPTSYLDNAKQFGQSLLPDSSKWSDIRAAYSPIGMAGVGDVKDTNKIVAAGRGVQQAIEDTVRPAHLLELQLQGVPLQEAAMRVKKYQRDYDPSSFTEFENKVMKQIIPFYSFTRKNLPPILEDLVKNPGKITPAMRLISGVRDPSQFAPAYMAEGASIPIPGAPDGFSRYISGLGTPLEDSGLQALGSLAKGDISRAMQIAGGGLNPLIKGPLEEAFGRQLYSGRRLDELHVGQVASLGGLLPDTVARQLQQIVSNSPAARFVGTGEQLADPRKGLGPTIANLLTGVKISDIDTAAQQNYAARDLAKNELRSTPNARVQEDVYVPAALKDQLTPEQRLIIDMLRVSNQRAAAQAKERQSQPR